MILNTENTKILLNGSKAYSGALFEKKWGYHIFKQEVSLYGNIVGFEAPFCLGSLSLTNSFVLALELPNCNTFGAICFTRLYCAQLGSLLTEITNQECFVDGNCHIINDKQCSISFSNTSSDTALINIVFSLCNENTKILSPILINEDFKQKAVESFHFLTKSIFIETQRDSF